jgi:DEAD/DEAH box helicase domain-containing protein
VSLRSSSHEVFSLVDVASGEMIGTLEAARAFSTVHEGAIYLHLGRAYEVVQLDLVERRAFLQPFTGDWFTQPKRETNTAIERLVERRETMGVRLSFGNVVVTEVVTGYQRKALADHQQIDFVALDLPETAFSTQALWYEVGDEVLDPTHPDAAFGIERLLGALHATEHAQIAVLPLLAMCDRWDIGGLSTNAHVQTGRPTIFIYDGHPGGVGITRQGYRGFERLVGDAHRLIAECRCKRGCPSCVQSPKCGNLNEPLSKGGAVGLLGSMLAAGS